MLSHPSDNIGKTFSDTQTVLYQYSSVFIGQRYTFTEFASEYPVFLPEKIVFQCQIVPEQLSDLHKERLSG